MSERYANKILTAFFMLLVILISITRYADFDLWWHLKLGESIVRNWALFSTDTFSYTWAGLPQYTGEWLADLVIYLSYSIGGLTGVNLLKAAVLLVAFHFLNKGVQTATGNSKPGVAAAIATLVLVLFAIRFRLFVRPYLFSIPFVSFFLFVLEKSGKDTRTKLIYCLPVAEALWANMSVGAIFGPLIAFFYLAEDSIRNRENIKRNLFLLAAISGATLASPETYHIYTLTLSLFTDPYKAVVGEYQPMSTQILWGFGIRYTWGYQVITLLSAIYFVVFRGWKSLAHILLFVFFFIETLLQVRMIEFFALIAAPMAAIPMERLFAAMSGRNGERCVQVTGIAALAVAAAIPLSIAGNRTYPFGNVVKEDTFPAEALSFLDREGITGRMFNGYSIGGYIIWRAPDRKVFFDGRYRRLYSARFYQEYTGMMEDESAWKKGEQQYGFDHAIIEYEMLSRRFPLHLNSNPSWALVYWDNHSAVYLKRLPKYEKVIAAREYRIIKPNFYDFSYLKKISTADSQGIIREIDREIALNPSNQEPLLAKALLLYDLGPGYRGDIVELLRKSIGMKPDLGMEHSAMAYLLMEQGKREEARQEVLKAINLDPKDLGAWELGKRLGLKLTLPKGAHP